MFIIRMQGNLHDRIFESAICSALLYGKNDFAEGFKILLNTSKNKFVGLSK